MAALAQSTRRKLALLHLAQELQKVYRPYLDKVTINSIASTEVAATPVWSIQFFEEDGRRPVEDFLDDLDNPRRAKVVAVVALLGEQGPNSSVSVLKPGPRKNPKAQNAVREGSLPSSLLRRARTDLCLAACLSEEHREGTRERYSDRGKPNEKVCSAA